MRNIKSGLRITPQTEKRKQGNGSQLGISMLKRLGEVGGERKCGRNERFWAQTDWSYLIVCFFILKCPGGREVPSPKSSTVPLRLLLLNRGKSHSRHSSVGVSSLEGGIRFLLYSHLVVQLESGYEALLAKTLNSKWPLLCVLSCCPFHSSLSLPPNLPTLPLPLHHLENCSPLALPFSGSTGHVLLCYLVVCTKLPFITSFLVPRPVVWEGPDPAHFSLFHV